MHPLFSYLNTNFSILLHTGIIIVKIKIIMFNKKTIDVSQSNTFLIMSIIKSFMFYIYTIMHRTLQLLIYFCHFYK